MIEYLSLGPVKSTSLLLLNEWLKGNLSQKTGVTSGFLFIFYFKIVFWLCDRITKKNLC